MNFCHFMVFQRDDAGPALSPHDREALVQRLASVPTLQHALIHEPAQTSDPYLNDGAPPVLALQLYFAELSDLEAALAPTSPLQDLARPDVFPSLAGVPVTQQAMLTRRFPVPQPRPQQDAADSRGTYMVAYEGVAEDMNLWLSHYLGHHPPIMARFPGIREIEIYSRVDWCGFFPAQRVDFMQRNKVVFDSPEALTAALNSPVRHEMRADFKSFPPFSGRNTHYPMLTRSL